MSRSSRRIAWSQNFLHSRKLVTRLIDLSGISETDVVVEIGAGQGIITKQLAARSRHVFAIEWDLHYVEIVRSRVRNQPNVTVFACDFLQFPLPATPYKVFANIPYRITTAIVAKLTSGVAPPSDAFLAVQREAAEKFTGVPRESMVSTCLKPWFDVSIVHEFRRQDFVPQPAVDSVLLRIRRREQPMIAWHDRDRFVQLVETIFSAWQPTMEKAIRKLFSRNAGRDVLRELGRLPAVKPSAATLDDWIALYRTLDAVDDDRVWSICASASMRLRHQQATLDRPTQTRARRSREGNSFRSR